MGPVHRGWVRLAHSLAWTCATGAAVTLSWWGVRSVMAGTAFDPPRAVPIAEQARGAASTSEPQTSSTHAAAPTASPAASQAPSPARSGSSPSQRPSDNGALALRPHGSGPSAAVRVQGYPVAGGRVVFAVGSSSAELVSATPSAGWRMQVWKQPKWIRVTFTREGNAPREVSVFCTWHDHPPLVEVYEN
ncbi:hypothetical protein [Streptomyces sp. NPDC006879]|uniref:hypothetical protein n=1 Tax=Streptomyces sp. NPDC006879 TaxID=3364767 RepID=UPI0036C2948A